jgi:hypothetical protein
MTNVAEGNGYNETTGSPIRGRVLIGIGGALVALLAAALLMPPRLLVAGGSSRESLAPGRGRPIRETFVLRNPGPLPIRLDVRPSGCGCAAVKLSSGVIWPFGTETVTVMLDADGAGSRTEPVGLRMSGPVRSAGLWLFVRYSIDHPAKLASR